VKKDSFGRYNALLPIPQMQLYVEDVLDPRWSFEPKNNFRVDFGFWTGTKLIAVEIDGNEPEGYAHDVRRDRLLRRADVDVVRILNTEIDQHGRNLMTPSYREVLRSTGRRPPCQNVRRINPVAQRQPGRVAERHRRAGLGFH
jgi:hypothetical protein